MWYQKSYVRTPKMPEGWTVERATAAIIAAADYRKFENAFLMIKYQGRRTLRDFVAVCEGKDPTKWKDARAEDRAVMRVLTGEAELPKADHRHRKEEPAWWER